LPLIPIITLQLPSNKELELPINIFDFRKAKGVPEPERNTTKPITICFDR
jgi:hypothetical protein